MNANSLSLSAGQTCLSLNLCSANSSACSFDASTPVCDSNGLLDGGSGPSSTTATIGGAVGGCLGALLFFAVAFVARRRIRYRNHYGAFLSHYKAEAKTEVRIAKDRLETALGLPVFLDTDNLTSLSVLMETVKTLKGYGALVLFLTPEVYTRPYVLCELYTAVCASVPIVTVEVVGKGFDYKHEAEFLKYLDKQLDVRNPGATSVLLETYPNLDMIDVAYQLSNVLPLIIAKKFTPDGDSLSLQGTFASIAQAIKTAKVMHPPISKDLWLATREQEAM